MCDKGIWHEARDPHSGGIYWYNPSTRESTHVGAPKPSHVAAPRPVPVKSEPNAPAQQQGDKKNARLPASIAWKKVLDPETKLHYWWNTSTDAVTYAGAPQPF